MATRSSLLKRPQREAWEVKMRSGPVDDRPMLEQLSAKYDDDKKGWQPRAESDL
jgi:hypothetical protein